MKTTVLQPNFFPFKSYFDIIKKVDKVVFSDDSFYNNKSWVDKTIIKKDDQKFIFKIPTISHFQSEPLSDITIVSQNWKKNFLKIVGTQYQNSINFDKVFPMIKEVVYLPIDSVSMISAYSVFRTSELLGHNVKFSLASISHKGIRGSFRNKIIEICKREKADQFYTFSMYRETFDSHFFIKNNINISYYSSTESNNYSIIDYMMNDHQLFKK